MSNNKDLLYQPQIGYKKSYYTEGKFKDDDVVKQPTKTIIDNPIIPVIDNLIATIDNNLKWVPQIIKETYLSPYVALTDEYYKIIDTPQEDPVIPDPEPVPSDTDPDDEDVPDPFVKGPDIYIERISTLLPH